MTPETLIDVGVAVLGAGLLAAGMLVGGGWIALRRQWWKLLLLAAVVLALIPASQWIEGRHGGDLPTIGLVLLSVALLYLEYRRFSRLTPDERTRLRGQLRRPAIWWLLGVLVVGVFILPLIVVAMVD